MADEQKIAVSEVVKVCSEITLNVAMALATNILMSMSITNYEEKKLTGNKVVTPTNDETSLESKESTGVANDSSLVKDEVAAQNGEIDAAETEAKAATTETTAAETSTSAIQTKAGTADIAAKGIKLN